MSNSQTGITRFSGQNSDKDTIHIGLYCGYN